EFANTCKAMFAAGSSSTEEELFNGAYYQQKIVPPGDFSTVAPGLRHGMGAEDPVRPEFQIGDGCLIDQLVGDTYGRISGLPPVFRPDNVKTTLASIHALNYVADFGYFTNYMRTFAVH